MPLALVVSVVEPSCANATVVTLPTAMCAHKSTPALPTTVDAVQMRRAPPQLGPTTSSVLAIRVTWAMDSFVSPMVAAHGTAHPHPPLTGTGVIRHPLALV